MPTGEKLEAANHQVAAFSIRGSCLRSSALAVITNVFWEIIYQAFLLVLSENVNPRRGAGSTAGA